MKSTAQRAATAALLAASPVTAAISGEHWSRCQITHGNPLLADEILIKRFWKNSGPERKFSSFAAVRTRGLPWSVNLRSGQRDYHLYIAGRSIRP
jgi:hypothetical protein